MKFILLIHGDESLSLHQGDPGWQDLWDDYVALDCAAKEAGVLIDSQPFAPSSSAVSVEVVEGFVKVGHGTVERTNRQLGGYYLLQCRDQAEAIEWAARIPDASRGATVEVRPIFEMG